MLELTNLETLAHENDSIIEIFDSPLEFTTSFEPETNRRSKEHDIKDAILFIIFKAWFWVSETFFLIIFRPFLSPTDLFLRKQTAFNFYFKITVLCDWIHSHSLIRHTNWYLFTSSMIDIFKMALTEKGHTTTIAQR